MKKYDNQEGFTLIELVFAILMLIIGILGAVIMQHAAIQGNDTAVHLTGAANWASDQQETLMALSNSNTDLLDSNNSGANAGVTGLDNTDVIGSLSDGGPVTKGDYIVFWNVADDYPVFGTKTIRVIVRRIDKGVVKNVTLDFTKVRPI